MKIEPFAAAETYVKYPEVPPEYCCPIGGELMRDPVRIFDTEYTHIYEASNIQTFFSYCRRDNKVPFSPLTRQTLFSEKLVDATDSYAKIKKFTGEYPQLNHRMARAPATNPAQVCATSSDFLARLKVFHAAGHLATVERTRHEVIVGSAVLTPLVFFLWGGLSTQQNLCLQALLGVVYGFHITFQLEKAQRVRVEALAPQLKECDEVRRFVLSQPLAPDVRDLCISYLDSVDDLIRPRALNYAGGEGAVAASLQGVIAGIQAASWAGKGLRSDQAIFMCFLMLCIGFLIVTVLNSFTQSAWRLPQSLHPSGYHLPEPPVYLNDFPAALAPFPEHPNEIPLTEFDYFLRRSHMPQNP